MPPEPFDLNHSCGSTEAGATVPSHGGEGWGFFWLVSRIDAVTGGAEPEFEDAKSNQQFVVIKYNTATEGRCEILEPQFSCIDTAQEHWTALRPTAVAL